MFKRKVCVTPKGYLALIEYAAYQAQEALKEPVNIEEAQKWCDETMRNVQLAMSALKK